MKLLIVGSDKKYAIENFYVRYLRGSVEVSVFAAQSLFYDYYQRHILNKVIFKAGLSNIYTSINTTLKRKIAQENPDIIWVFKGMEIFPETLKWIRSRGIILVNYNPDNPFLFSGKGSGNGNITNSIGLYDVHFTYDRNILQQLEQRYNAKTYLLPFGYDLSESDYGKYAAQAEVVKACFLGNPDDQRAAFLSEIAEELPLDVYGHNWERFLRHPNVTICEPVYREELWSALRRYRVQINLMRPHNPESHNMRSFEVPGVGGILLAPDTSDHRMFFKEGEEIFIYKNVSACIEQAKHLLSIGKDKADTIRTYARRRSVESGYSYESRAEQVLDHLNALLNGKA